MASAWYVSSAAYAAIPQWAATTGYTVGQIIRGLAAPSAGNRHVYRCTTAGTSLSTEPSWSLNNNATTVAGATWTCVSGQSAYGWGAAAGDLGTVTNDGTGTGYAAVGDTVYVSSDHAETAAAAATYLKHVSGAWAGLFTLIISVNRGGSVPPAPSDITNGASLATTGANSLLLDPVYPVYMQGFTLSAGASVVFNVIYTKPLYLKNCTLVVNNATSGSRVGSNGTAKVTLDNTTVQFGAVGQGIGTLLSSAPFDLTWINTMSALAGATLPTTLFLGSNAYNVLCRGVDLSAETTSLLTTTAAGSKVLLDSCKIAPGVTRLTGASTATADILELVNCFDGTNTLNERYMAEGSVVTERTITLSGGATDDISTFSLKMVSATTIDRWVQPLESFWFDVENTLVGSSYTATVQIVSSGTLNNDDISLLLEHQGTSGSPVASFVSSLPATPLTTNATLPTSAATWNSLPTTPVEQYIQVTFTPQAAGRVRGQIRLGKASTTVYVNPQITIV